VLECLSIGTQADKRNILSAIFDKKPRGAVQVCLSLLSFSGDP